MSARSVLLALVVPLAGCASDATRSAADADAFARDAESRAGVSRESHADAESRDASDGTIADSVHALLAEPMSEETAARIALVNNRDVRAELERLGVARADLAQASLPANPVFSGNVKFFDVGREIELDLAESFVELFLRPLRERLAASELAAREAEVKSALVDIAFEARRTLVSVRAAHDREELDRRALATADSSFDLMKHLHDAGNVGDPELTRQEIARDRAKLDLADAITESRVARERLNALLGLWGADAGAWRVDGGLVATSESAAVTDGIECRAVERSLEIALARARADAAAQRAGIASWEPFLQHGEFGVAAKAEAGGGFGLGPSFRIPLPFFDRGAARTAAAEADLRMALHRMTAAAVETRAAARALREKLLAAQERAAFVRGVDLPVHARLVQETLRNYNAMQIGAFDVLDARALELEAEHEAIESARDAALARIDLAELLAGRVNHERLTADLGSSRARGGAAPSGGHR